MRVGKLSSSSLYPGSMLAWNIKDLIQTGIDTIMYAIQSTNSQSHLSSLHMLKTKHLVLRTNVLSCALCKKEMRDFCSDGHITQEKTIFGAALTAAFLKGVANVKEPKDKRLSFTCFRI